MSSIGTGIAAGVAAVHQTARQTARAKDIARNTSHRIADDNRDEFVERLQSAAATGDPDAELPDHQAPAYEQLYLHDGDGRPLADPPAPASCPLPLPHPAGAAMGHEHTATVIAPDGSVAAFILAPEPESPLYQHLDIRA